MRSRFTHTVGSYRVCLFVDEDCFFFQRLKITVTFIMFLFGRAALPGSLVFDSDLVSNPLEALFKALISECTCFLYSDFVFELAFTG